MSVNNIIAFSPYNWDHALAVLRLVSPLQYAGLHLIHGLENWKFHPEHISLGDIIVTQRDFPHFRNMYQTVVDQARNEGKPLVYEIDDLLLELPGEHPDHSIGYYTPGLFDMLQAIIEADIVTTTTPALRAYLEPFNPNIFVLPNYLDRKLWDMLDITGKSDSTKVVIGYMGSNTHLPDLEQVIPVLQKLLDRYNERLQLCFWGGEPPEAINGLPQVQWIQTKATSYSSFAQSFASQNCDIFIAPLKDSLFNRCKSNIKFLEYSSRGVPGVYSRITPYEDIIDHGVNGFLATTLEEWETCLTALIVDPLLREQVGRNAQKTVKDHWLVSQHAEKWTQAYQAAVDIARNKEKQSQKQQYLEVFTRVASQVRNWQFGLEKQINTKDQRINELEKRLVDAEHFQNELKKSNVWKLVKYLWRIRSIFTPLDDH